MSTQVDEMQDQIVRAAKWLHDFVGDQSRRLTNARDHGQALIAAIGAFYEDHDEAKLRAAYDAYLSADSGNFND